MQQELIYFDNAATTKPCAAAVFAAGEAMSFDWGNPSSAHFFGAAARRRLEGARAEIMSTLTPRYGGAAGALYFCGSGTEATNLALLGYMRAKRRRGRIIVGAGEHASVNETVKAIETSFGVVGEENGIEIVYIPTEGGELDLDALRDACREEVAAVSLMLVNNETGARYDVERAFDIVRTAAPGAFLHCDAVQGYMKTPFTYKSLGADAITISAHKIGGIKGIGALYIDTASLRARNLSPVIFGGGQEGGYRSGTENVPAALAFAAAAKSAHDNMERDIAAMSALRDYIIAGLDGVGARCNLPPVAAPHIISVTLPDIKSETMLNFLSAKGICVSSGSACSTHAKKLSRALLAFGLTEREADTTIRVSLCPDNNKEQADALIAATAEGIASLCKIRSK